MTRKWLIDNQGLFFMAPAMILFVVFVLYPIFYIFNASMYDWDGINEAIYIGVQNYIEMFTDDRAFALSIRNSIYWTFLTIFPQMFLGFHPGLYLDLGHSAAKCLSHHLLHARHHVAGCARHRLAADLRALRRLAGRPGARNRRHVSDPALYCRSQDRHLFHHLRQRLAVDRLLHADVCGRLAGLVARGAERGRSRWRRRTRQRIQYIILPMLRHVHLTLILLGVIGTLQTFALVFMLTKGGPNHATEMLPTYIFQKAFTLQSMGYASAVAVVLLVIALSASIFQVRVLGSRFTIGG